MIQGWASKEGDDFFKHQRSQADEGSAKTVSILNQMMQRIAEENQRTTGAFTIRSHGDNNEGKPMILDMCAAPGLYLQYALKTNPGAGALGFSLPRDQGGHEVVLETSDTVRIKFLDITMLAADMGLSAEDIPADHPDSGNFLTEAQLQPDQTFDLVLCDGQVLRTHEPHRAAYRREQSAREPRRLTLTQLTIGLEHLRPGGTMVVLLHRLEAWDTVLLLRVFTGFSTVRLFKPRGGHAKRSSFYMIATDVRSRDGEALAALEGWRRDWRLATLETDEARWMELRQDYAGGWEGASDVETVLREFGPELIRMGRMVWTIQADALERAPFIKRRGWR